MPPTYPAITPVTSLILRRDSNPTRKLQLIRVINHNDQGLAKIVFPQQSILFETIFKRELEVYIRQKGRQVLNKIISCNNLQSLQSLEN